MVCGVEGDAPCCNERGDEKSEMRLTFKVSLSRLSKCACPRRYKVSLSTLYRVREEEKRRSRRRRTRTAAAAAAAAEAAICEHMDTCVGLSIWLLECRL